MDEARRVVETHSARQVAYRLDAIDLDGQTHHELYVNDHLLTATCHDATGKLLVNLALAGVPTGQKHAEILIGGLGVGVVLRHVLDHPGVQAACVVEGESRVVQWNRTHLGHADLLDDRRVELVVGQFADYAQGTPRNYHGIVLQVDLGPERVARPDNRRVYSLSMLRVLQSRLRSGGALAIRTQVPSTSYERALREIFGSVHLETAVDRDADRAERTCAVYQVRA